MTQTHGAGNGGARSVGCALGGGSVMFCDVDVAGEGVCLEQRVVVDVLLCLSLGGGGCLPAAVQVVVPHGL